MRFCNSLGMLLARLLISAIFIWSGVGKLMTWDTYVSYMASKGMTYIPYFLGAAALVEIVGGVFLVIGFKARITALILILYLMPVTYIFHDFWNIADNAEKTTQLAHFLSNLAIMGGLLSLVTVGPGTYAVDRRTYLKEDSCDKKVD